MMDFVSNVVILSPPPVMKSAGDYLIDDRLMFSFDLNDCLSVIDRQVSMLCCRHLELTPLYVVDRLLNIYIRALSTGWNGMIDDD